MQDINALSMLYWQCRKIAEGFVQIFQSILLVCNLRFHAGRLRFLGLASVYIPDAAGA